MPTPAAPGAGDERLSRVSALRAQLSAMHARSSKPAADASSRTGRADAAPAPGDLAADPGSGLPGQLRETEQGSLRQVITRFDEDHCHGAAPIVRALSATAQELSVLALDPALAEVDFSRALYIDTETTGLSGGAGTVPFLIGMAWFEQREFVVEQLLLEAPGLERPMLERLSERLRSASVVISFNGKSFDWPLLRTRFILQRVPAPRLAAHLDLLHCARRVYKRRLGSVRLVQLEEAVLGFVRCDDIAGELIPQTYLGFLRGRTTGVELWPIVEHNGHDLVALAALLGELSRCFRGEAPRVDPRDRLGLAQVAARADAGERAVHHAEAAAATDHYGELAWEALYLAGQLKLRRGDCAGAQSAFEAALEAAVSHREGLSRVHLALSKLFEHKLKQWERALEHAAQTGCAEGEEACLSRCQRIRKKQDAQRRRVAASRGSPAPQSDVTPSVAVEPAQR